MNWQIARRLKGVKFVRSEPICMITPIHRDDLEDFDPEIRDLESDPELYQSYQVGHESRKAIVAETKGKPLKDGRRPIQGHYIRGEGHLGERAEHGHQTKVLVKPFTGFVEQAESTQTESPHKRPPNVRQKVFGKRS